MLEMDVSSLVEFNVTSFLLQCGSVCCVWVPYNVLGLGAGGKLCAKRGF